MSFDHLSDAELMQTVVKAHNRIGQNVKNIQELHGMILCDKDLFKSAIEEVQKREIPVTITQVAQESDGSEKPASDGENDEQ